MSNLLVALPLRQRKPLRICTDVPLSIRPSSYSSSSSSSPTNRSITPGTTPSTSNLQCFFRVLCMHDFGSSDPVHLPFQKDEVLIIIQQEHSGWWAAMRPQGDRIGWIPGSFVLPLDRRKIAGYPDETPLPYESLLDSPLSAVHDPWVPVSEDYRVLSFQLVTPTDHALYKDPFDERVQNHDYESLFNLSNGERYSDIREICVPPIPDSPSPMARRPLLPPTPLSSEPSASQLTRSASPSLLDAESYHHPRPYGVDDQIPFLYLTAPDGSDAITPELISNMDIGESLVVFKSAAASHDDTCSEDSLQQHLGFPASLRLGMP